MMPLRLVLALLALALVLPHSASASSVVVPDGYATIQAAIDAGVDSVIVKDGTYPDSIIVARGVTLLPYSTNYHTAFPKVGRLGIGGFSANQTGADRGSSLHRTGVDPGLLVGLHGGDVRGMPVRFRPDQSRVRLRVTPQRFMVVSSTAAPIRLRTPSSS